MALEILTTFERKRIVEIRKKSFVWILIVILLAAIGFGVVYTKSKVIAQVNGESITEKELTDYMIQQGGQQALDSLITEKIIELESKKQNIQVSEDDIEKVLAKTKESFSSEEEFLQALETNSLTLDTLKKNITMNYKIKGLMEARNPITEDQITQYFENNKESFATMEQVKASHILVGTEELAKEVKAKLVAGESFSDLATQYSTDEASKAQGGELGFFGRGQMTKEFEDVAFSLGVGQVSDPVKTEYGYHIIKVEEKKEAKEANLEESKDQIKDSLLDEKVSTEFDAWLQERRAEYKIDNYLAK